MRKLFLCMFIAVFLMSAGMANADIVSYQGVFPDSDSGDWWYNHGGETFSGEFDLDAESFTFNSNAGNWNTADGNFLEFWDYRDDFPEYDLVVFDFDDMTFSLFDWEEDGTLDQIDVAVPSNGGVTSDSFTADITVVPVPAAVWLLGSGLFGLVGFRKKMMS